MYILILIQSQLVVYYIYMLEAMHVVLASMHADKNIVCLHGICENV